MPLVTLLTDFGDDSPYPAEVRAVLCAPTFGAPIRVVDITHRVPRHDVRRGAYLLRTACTAFPEGTVHVAVVDPGVGTERRPLAIRAGGMVFVGPDNGLLLPAARAVGSPEIRQILHPDLRRLEVSSTFHGRDLFAPAARWLALGFPFEAVGPRVEDPVELPLRTFSGERCSPRTRSGTSPRTSRALGLRTFREDWRWWWPAGGTLRSGCGRTERENEGSFWCSWEATGSWRSRCGRGALWNGWAHNREIPLPSPPHPTVHRIVTMGCFR
jgi:hypothetical protein